MDTPVVAQSASSVLEQYDIVLLDQFGVLHDGKRAIPGAIECVEALRSGGKAVVVCSNSSQRKELALSRWVKMGFPSDVGFLTSGEVSYQHLKSMLQGKKKQRVLVFSWHDPALTANWLEGLDVEQLATSDAVETADLLLFHGPDAVGSDRNPVGLGDEGSINESAMLTLERAARAGVKAVCANIDLKAVDANGNIRYMPGNLLKIYKAMGGDCVGFGKPKEEFFNAALEMALGQLGAQSASSASPFQVIKNGAGKDNMPRPGVKLVRAIHVGDSLEHDIAGARAVRIDSLLITDAGIHKDDFAMPAQLAVAAGAVSSGTLCNANNEAAQKPSLLHTVLSFCEEHGYPTPTFILPWLK